MISVTYDSGKVRQFDLQKSPDRVSIIVSLMTIDEMVRFFLPSEAKLFAVNLGLKPKGSEKAICTQIYNYFKG